MGLTNSKSKAKRKPHPNVTKQAELNLSDDDSVDHLKTTVELAGGTDALLTLLEHVEQAGGVDGVKESIKQYQRLSEIFA